MKILVIRFSSLGDVVLVTPLFQKIKHHYPSSHVTFLTDRKFIDLFRTDPNIDRIIPYNVSGENLMYLIRYLKKIREERYDMIIDCHIIPRSLFFLFLGRAARRKRLNKFSLQRRLMVKSHIRKMIPHIVDRYLATFNGKNGNDYKPKIYLEKKEMEKVGKLLSKMRGRKKVVGFAPGASKKAKVWQLEKLQNLALTLMEKNNVYIVLFGNKSEISLVKRIQKELHNRCLNLVGKTGIRELALFLKGCDVLFSTDSGTMHIAVAVGTPVVSIFGPTVPEFGFAPYNQKSVIVSKPLPCRPCSLHGTDICPLGHHDCMKLIDVEEVRMEIERLLANEKTRIKEKG
ncbi:MAG: lipopolysaccharide heptosyltransferase II [Candidatus Cloacimonadota bacterium]|nr:MAG: lipopolysaccharide heptosyltransferase II [Candidatus Cloacimonadota bacterium]